MARAKELSRQPADVITWKLDANLAAGEFGSSEELYRADEVSDLDARRLCIVILPLRLTIVGTLGVTDGRNVYRMD